MIESVAVIEVPVETAPVQSARPMVRFLRRFARNKVGVGALVFFALMVVMALAAPLIANHDPLKQNLRDVLKAPRAHNWFGTDDLGRDLFSRTVYASRVSLVAAAEAVLVAVAIGIPFGVLAGYWRGFVDTVVMRATDALLSFPPLILAIAIVGILGPGLNNAMLAVGLVFAPRFARLVRGAVLAVREETFVEASHSIGTPPLRIIRLHIIPNVASPLIVQASLTFGLAMLAEAGISFLGLGVQPPQASWGSLLGRALDYVTTSYWLVVFPGLFIAFTVLSLNIVGDALRDSIGREERR